ncbi:hypothetical protein ABW20_dc0108025 [Dactylellina cionopaga]|nr:hypothetical protein ABW20_dc0108025 [Dactylellina cionopaga]
MFGITEFIIVTASVGAFAAGILATEAVKTLEYLWRERKQRNAQEIRYFGRPLKSKERKLMKKAWTLHAMNAAVGQDIADWGIGRRGTGPGRSIPDEYRPPPHQAPDPKLYPEPEEPANDVPTTSTTTLQPL